MARVVVFGSWPVSLLNFRGPLLAAMVNAGHEVHAVSPQADSEVLSGLKALGVSHSAIPLARAGINPLQDLRSLIFLLRLLRKLRPDCLFAYTIKPIVYGGLAARIAGVQFYAMVTGLGYSFAGSGLKARAIGLVASWLYRVALAKADTVFFQNQDNMDVFLGRGLLPPSAKTRVVAGSGVDLDHFDVAALPESPVFLMVARLLRDKGVVEYVEAARQIKSAYPEAHFLLVGWIDDNPAAILEAELESWIKDDVVEYLGYLDDIRPAMAMSSVYCLPSYHEGMPRTVLEAMAMGRPVITTDVPGCRETVLEGENGFLVPTRDVNALICAMERFIKEPGLVPKFGAASRRLCMDKFDVNKVNKDILDGMSIAHDMG